jgi:hypothetical protein
MSSKMSYVANIWVLTVVATAIGVFIYLILGDTPKTLPIIKLSYFTDENEVADSVSKRLYQEINQNKFYWIGTEPDKLEYIDVAIAFKNDLEKKYKFTRVIADGELKLSKEVLTHLGVTDVVDFKENLNQVGERFSELEKSDTPYLFVTAAIYSNSLLLKNPLHVLKEKFALNPMTFSFAYFPTTLEDEKNMLFQCRTEDSSGISDWGCVVLNKARVNRRKLEKDNARPWLGVMDLSGERDYILVLKKK